jgi:hypothetical protein
MDKSSKTPQTYKPKEVKITYFNNIALPGKVVGAFTLSFYGLGDDGKMYAYDNVKKDWAEV